MIPLKKITFILALSIFLLVPSLVFAESNDNSEASSQSFRITTSPQGVANQNREMMENEGEDNMMQNEEREMEGTGESDLKNQNGQENMGEVAKRVHELLNTRTSGGIGDQIRLVAQEQVQTQQRIQDQLDKLNKRSRLLKFFIGNDIKEVAALKAQLEQNRLAIQNLTQLRIELANSADQTNIEAAVQALTDQNTTLEDTIGKAEAEKGIFAFIIRLFSRS